ncbi:MAG: fatty acid desaturase family protein [Dehalococcoidia bacterium]
MRVLDAGQLPADQPAKRAASAQETETSTVRPGSEYAELKRMITAAGLLQRQPGWYWVTILLTLLLLAFGVALLPFVRSPWLWPLDAVFLAFVYTQLGFIGHDTGHGQVVRNGWKRELISLVHGNLLLGVSAAWWVDKHNKHHSHPNQIDGDPDIEIPIIAFCEEQAMAMRGPQRFIGRYQSYLLLPLLSTVAYGLRISGTRFLFQNAVHHRALEVLLLVVHFALYGGLLVAVLGVWQAVLFFIVHQALFGVYLGSVFAPNHKGMPILGKESDLDFLHRQVLTSRNVRSHPLIDFWYGGLNYQIEHHLFPTMPRRNLKAAQGIIKAFCAERGISYHETGMVQSYREILRYLHEVSLMLRAG